MDAALTKIEEESSATHRWLEDLKEEMRSRYEETRKHVDILETKVMNMEKKLEEFSMQVFTTMQNMCKVQVIQKSHKKFLVYFYMVR